MLYNKDQLEKIRGAKKEWEEGPLRQALERFGAAESPSKFYTPLDLENFDFLEKVGFPGIPPFAAGRYPVSAVTTAWGRGSAAGLGGTLKRAGRYTGYGTPEDTRDFYKDVHARGLRVGGPNLAFDLPTQTGRDSDDDFSEGEVGKVGVAVDTLRDFEVIYDAFTGDMDLDKNLHLAPPVRATQIVMKTGCAFTLDCGTISLRRRHTTKHGEVSSRLLFLDLKQYKNQCKDCLSSTNKWFSETVR